MKKHWLILTIIAIAVIVTYYVAKVLYQSEQSLVDWIGKLPGRIWGTITSPFTAFANLFGGDGVTTTSGGTATQSGGQSDTPLTYFNDGYTISAPIDNLGQVSVGGVAL